MRLWSLHPRYLDAKGLVALWREALLAQAVLLGRTRGYRSHPQLRRFRESASPVGSVADYLRAVRKEASARGYAFDGSLIAPTRGKGRLPVARGQLAYEWGHLMGKLKTRDPARRARQRRMVRPTPHPLFRVEPGGVAAWERL